MVWPRQVLGTWRVDAGWGYLQTFDVSATLVDNKLVDRSDVVGASPVGTAPTISSFST